MLTVFLTCARMPATPATRRKIPRTAKNGASFGFKNGVGPALNGLFGRVAGTVEGYNYSPANKNSGITWTEAELDAFLANPSGKVPGTAMAAGQVADTDRRAAVLAYLASLKN